MNKKTYIERAEEILKGGLHDIGCYEYSSGNYTQEELEIYNDGLFDQLYQLYLEGVREAEELGIRKVGTWIKFPYRKGMKMTKNIDGSGGLVNVGCEVCGGKLVYVRGKYPGDNKRKVCPTCATEIIESLDSNCNNRDAYTEGKA